MMSENMRIQFENMEKSNGLGQRIKPEHMMSLQEINEARDVFGNIEFRDYEREQNTPEHLKYNKARFDEKWSKKNK
jgi:hypothetical protein